MRLQASSGDRDGIRYRQVCAGGLSTLFLALGVAACGGTTSKSMGMPDAGPVSPPDAKADLPLPEVGPDIRVESDSPVVLEDAHGDLPAKQDTLVDVIANQDSLADGPAKPDTLADLAADRPEGSDSASAEAGVQPDLAPADAQGADAPAEIPSRQAVQLYIETQRVYWAITTGYLCAPFTIERQNEDGSWRKLVLGVPFQCGCECPVAGSAHPTHLVAYNIWPATTWDAREMVVFSETKTCPNGPSARILQTVAQPAPPGHYRVTMSVLTTLPAACTSVGSTRQYECASPYGQGSTPADYSLCAGDMTAQGEFDLPASGDTKVDLLI